QRRALVEAMAEDVLAILARVRGLAGVVVGTVDPVAIGLAKRFGARVLGEGARDGHTGAVAAAVRMLVREGRDGMLTLPADIPCAAVAEVEAVLETHRPPLSFTIVPAHDGRGSNAVLVSPPDAVPLSFGNDSFLPHLQNARRRGIEPAVLRLPGLGLDLDNPADLAMIADMQPLLSSRTRQLVMALRDVCGLV
ncbi:MAG: NTP transferase domain-containing protein, partial [Acetobacteraceae bacterium]|nr:NTP transferase domain-containing protein [Acetobacteraceae bacterium]